MLIVTMVSMHPPERNCFPGELDKSWRNKAFRRNPAEMNQHRLQPRNMQRNISFLDWFIRSLLRIDYGPFGDEDWIRVG